MQYVKLAIAIAGLGAAAAIFFLRGDSQESLPDTDESRTEWMCASCTHVFSLTAAQYQQERDRAGSDAPLICAACAKKEAYRVATCPACETKYFSSDVPGHRGICPKCNPVNVVPVGGTTIEEKPAEEEAPVLDEEGKPVIINIF